MVTFLGATIFFLVAHMATAIGTHQPFHVELKLSRGFAAAILSAIGFFVLIERFSLWPLAFLVPNADDDLLPHFILVLNGHFVADFLWLAYGAAVHGSRPRIDLIVHHLLGMVVSFASYRIGIGFAMICVGLTSELMPVTTGLQAWAQVLDNRRLEHWATRLRLGVLVGWRLPLWILVLGIVLHEMSTAPRAEIEPVYNVAVGTALAIIALDLYWSRLCYQGLVAERHPATTGS